jgi:hypothetical protein
MVGKPGEPSDRVEEKGLEGALIREPSPASYTRSDNTSPAGRNRRDRSGRTAPTSKR